jgi:hypothetical protein
MQRHPAVLEDGSDLHGELLAALVALVDAAAVCLALETSDPAGVGIAAMRAGRAVRPQGRFEVPEGLVFVLKVPFREDGHG